MSVYDDIRKELKREKLSNQYFDYSNALDVVNRIEAREKQKAEANADTKTKMDSDKLRELLDFVYKDYSARLEEVLCHYIGQHMAEFPASRMNEMLLMLNQTFLATRISSAEHAIRIAEEHATYLKAYCDGEMYATEEIAKQHAPIQSRNAGTIIHYCSAYRKGEGDF